MLFCVCCVCLLFSCSSVSFICHQSMSASSVLCLSLVSCISAVLCVYICVDVRAVCMLCIAFVINVRLCFICVLFFSLMSCGCVILCVYMCRCVVCMRICSVVSASCLCFVLHAVSCVLFAKFVYIIYVLQHSSAHCVAPYRSCLQTWCVWISCNIYTSYFYVYVCVVFFCRVCPPCVCFCVSVL